MSVLEVSHRIQNIIEPDRLLVAWQPTDDSPDRIRRIIAEILRSDEENITFRYLVDSEDFKIAQTSGFSCYPAFKLTTNRGYREYNLGVLDALMLRLPPKERPDYGRFLDAIRIPYDIKISDFALLGYSEARLPGDGFSIIHPFDGAPAPCELLTEVAGYRHYGGGSEEIPFGKELSFVPEPDNPFDVNAIRIEFNGERIGYVNRGQTNAFHLWLKHNTVRAFLERKNGRVDRMRMLMFVEIS